MAKKEKIIVYSNENCPYCKQIKEKLTEEKIKFEEKQINEHEKDWANVTSLTGMPTVPTIYFKETYFVAGRDYMSPDHLIEIINNFEIVKHDLNELTIERIKTLNFSIAQAFQRLDASLRTLVDKIDNLNLQTKQLEENVDKSTD